MKSFLPFLILISGQNISAFEIDFYRDKNQSYTHQANLALHLADKSNWTAKVVKEHVEEAAKIYSQCGVKLKIESIDEIAVPKEEIYFDLEGYENLTDSRPVESAIELASKYRYDHLINTYWIQSFDQSFYSISATAIPKIRLRQADQLPTLNSVWLTNRVEYDRQFTPEQGGFAADYNVLAHELGHILLNSTHVRDFSIHNLMHESMYSLNGRLTTDQCNEIKKSDLVIPLENQQEVCNEIDSPLRGQVHFLSGKKDCKAANKIISFLEQVQSDISDLTPVTHIDFYFTDSGNELWYRDQNIFEGPLNQSYDYYGKELLHKKQSEALWVHELAHAIFNRQLALDWPWFKKRLEHFKKWQIAIRKNDTYAVNEILAAIMSQENAHKYETIVGPLHELFADLVAAIYFEDPKIISYAIAPPKDIEGTTLSQHEIEHLNERNFLSQINIEDHQNRDTHSLYAPTRSELWRYVQKNLYRKTAKQKIVRDLYNILKNEILSLSKQQSSNLTVKELNTRLLKHLN